MLFAAHLRHDDGEPVADDARQQIAVEGVDRAARRDLAQQLVPAVAAEGIVESLEVLDVEHQDREPPAFARRGPDVLPQALAEELVVGEPGERVVVGQVLQALLLDDVGVGERHVARQLLEQPELFGVEEVRVGRPAGRAPRPLCRSTTSGNIAMERIPRFAHSSRRGMRASFCASFATAGRRLRSASPTRP